MGCSKVIFIKMTEMPRLMISNYGTSWKKGGKTSVMLFFRYISKLISDIRIPTPGKESLEKRTFVRSKV